MLLSVLTTNKITSTKNNVTPAANILSFVSSVNKFSNSAPAQSETLQKFGQNSRQPMATSEEGRLARDREDNGQLSSATPNVSAKPEEKTKSILNGGDVISRLARMKK